MGSSHLRHGVCLGKSSLSASQGDRPWQSDLWSLECWPACGPNFHRTMKAKRLPRSSEGLHTLPRAFKDVPKASEGLHEARIGLVCG